LNTSQFRDCVAVGDAQGRFFATGTLVAPQVVVTAGHAFDEDIGQILIGDDFRSLPSAIATIKVVKKIRKDWKVNVDSNLPRFENDLTLLVLDRPVLPAEAEPRAIATDSIIAAAKLAVVAGFGSTGDMTIPGAGTGPKRSVEIPIATTDCNQNVDRVTDQQAFGCAAGKELVAADPLRRKDSCEGDSGGPLYVQKDGKYFVAGATSGGIRSTSARTACPSSVAPAGSTSAWTSTWTGLMKSLETTGSLNPRKSLNNESSGHRLNIYGRTPPIRFPFWRPDQCGDVHRRGLVTAGRE
jgi:secreted trypsin-like serine protease